MSRLRAIGLDFEGCKKHVQTPNTRSSRVFKVFHQNGVLESLMKDYVIAAPKEAIMTVLKHIREKYDGIESYLVSNGMSEIEIASIRHNICQKDVIST